MQETFFGTGFAPLRGGPMRYIAETGRDKLVSRRHSPERIHGSRFAPDSVWHAIGDTDNKG